MYLFECFYSSMVTFLVIVTVGNQPKYLSGLMPRRNLAGADRCEISQVYFYQTKD